MRKKVSIPPRAKLYLMNELSLTKISIKILMSLNSCCDLKLLLKYRILSIEAKLNFYFVIWKQLKKVVRLCQYGNIFYSQYCIC